MKTLAILSRSVQPLSLAFQPERLAFHRWLVGVQHRRTQTNTKLTKNFRDSLQPLLLVEVYLLLIHFCVTSMRKTRDNHRSVGYGFSLLMILLPFSNWQT